MKDQELVNALRCVSTAGGPIGDCKKCPFCKTEPVPKNLKKAVSLTEWSSCDVDAVGIAAADQLENQSAHIAALQKEIEKLRGDLKLHRCATCDFWRENDPRCMNGQSQWGGKAVPKDNYCRYWEHHTDWIPVTERLPENGVETLCWYEYFRYGDFNAMFATYGIGYQFHGNWGGEVANGRNAKVLAWMPLPEPPEVENAETK